LVKELKIEAAEEVFTAALLHDVGKLVLGEFVADDFNKIDNVLSPEITFETAEDMVLGTNHADIGARILNQWSLPPGIVNAVRWHHDPDSAEQSDLTLDIVHVADVLCLMIGIGVGRDGLQHQPSAAAIDRLGLAPGHLEKVASQTLQWVEELSAVIGDN
jgi:putative nucleotidyltransferase with HDIG domain